jgi:hypothetical protein
MQPKLTHLSLAFLFILLSLGARSQSHKNLIISLNGGVSLPFGDFSGTTLYKDSFAKTGVSLGGDATWFFHRYLGVSLSFSQSNNPIDVTTLTIEKLNDDPFLQELSIRSESFTSTVITAGIYGRWAFGENFTVYGKVMAGLLRSQTPYQLYRTTYFELGPTYYEITSSRDDAFVVVPGIGGMYLFKRGLGVKLDADYVGRKMTFPFQTSNGMRYDEREVRYIQIMIGLVVGF